MKTIKEFYLQIPGMGKLIVKATCKAEALIIYQAMGHQVGADHIHLLKTVPRKTGPKTATPGWWAKVWAKASEGASYPEAKNPR